jgi:hypothetical protein
MSLQKVTVPIDNILLDPNNPRFADISEDSLNVPEARTNDAMVQEEAYKKMLHPKFDVITLAKSIETVGFIPVDNIVVKRLADTDKYIVVEGNRRTTAITYLIKEFQRGQSILGAEKIAEISTLDVLEIDPVTAANDYFGMVIQGIRNVSGIKEWDAFQKAQFINNMIDKGKEPNTISKMLGMQVKDVNRYYKTYSAMMQFKQDNEYGSYFKNSLFSHFDELVKKPALRIYFEWNDDTFQFDNIDGIRRFYDWLTPDEDGNVTFSDAREIRKLADLINDPPALTFLDDKNLQKGINYVESKTFNKVVTFDECMNKINNAIDAFKNILGEEYEGKLSDEEVTNLEAAITEMNGKLQKIKKLKASEQGATI